MIWGRLPARSPGGKCEVDEFLPSLCRCAFVSLLCLYKIRTNAKKTRGEGLAPVEYVPNSFRLMNESHLAAESVNITKKVLVGDTGVVAVISIVKMASLFVPLEL